MTIPLTGPDGKPTRWEFPTFDGRVMAYIQRSFDYMAPEYGLDEVLNTASDMYSLGCLVYSVHCKGDPPFRNHGSLGGLRENAGRPLQGIDRLDRDLQGLSQLISKNRLQQCYSYASLIDHTTPPKSLNSHEPSLPLFFLFSPYFDLKLFGQVEFCSKDKRRESVIHERIDRGIE